MPGVGVPAHPGLAAPRRCRSVDAGVGGLMLFGVPRDEDKDADGSCGVRPDGILNVALRDLAEDLGAAT